MCEAKTYMKCEVTKAQGDKAILSQMVTSFLCVCVGVLAVCVEANMCGYQERRKEWEAGERQVWGGCGRKCIAKHCKKGILEEKGPKQT